MDDEDNAALTLVPLPPFPVSDALMSAPLPLSPRSEVAIMSPWICCSRLQLAAPTGRSPFAAVPLPPGT